MKSNLLGNDYLYRSARGKEKVGQQTSSTRQNRHDGELIEEALALSMLSALLPSSIDSRILHAVQ
jgi:hypothetical protein